MSKQGKIWIICILGFILIVVLGFYASTSKRNREDITSTDGLETGASISVEEYQKEQDTIMAEMMKDMEDIPRSGSDAVDFLNGMIPHHQSAVAMSESYLKHGGKNESLKKLAGDIITQQNDEIEQMKSMVEKLQKEDLKDEEAESGYMEEYGKMMHSNHSGQSVAQNIDFAFAEGMIMHHQMAIDMSEVVLKYTDEDDVEELAQNITKLQKKEIEEMNGILEDMAEMP